MNLKHFTQTTPDHVLDSPSITINMASYNIIFNVPAIDLLHLKRGQKVVFSQDMASLEWFLYKTQEEEAFLLRKFTTTPNLVFSCKQLCKELYKTLQLSGNKNVLKIARDAKDYGNLQLFKLAHPTAKYTTPSPKTIIQRRPPNLLKRLLLSDVEAVLLV